MSIARAALAAFMLLAGSNAAFADSVEAQCELRAEEKQKPVDKLPCNFSQSQGYVTIALDDGTVFQLTPGEGVGNYTDAKGEPAYRKSGLGDAGLIFSIGEALVYVYW